MVISTAAHTDSCPPAVSVCCLRNGSNPVQPLASPHLQGHSGEVRLNGGEIPKLTAVTNSYDVFSENYGSDGRPLLCIAVGGKLIFILCGEAISFPKHRKLPF